MSEKNNQANQPLNNQSNSAQPTQIGGQSYGFQPQPGFQQPPPAYDQSFTAQGQHQHQFYPGQQGAPVVTIIANTIYGPDPKVITCPSCGQMVTTRIDYESSTKTHLMAGLLCLLIWPCFWLPYAIDSCKNANHLCPSCNAYLGTYHG
ncbi:lipopolysaccharide-induced tumor necrosis factor-alpha factor homolog [Chironomus tepperi]|uniref:lipopolysaccharide-induced tumor necrosis factor-alpha factor homolog n=1 Tax=Chironomus tepperi TaxID=113505 RepID=UPI00391FA53F